MNYLFIASCVSTVIAAVHCSNEVPVLTWGSGSELFNFHTSAHKKLSTSEFYNNFIEKLALIEPSAIIAFVEETLSPEDFVSRDTAEESAYPFLSKHVELGGSMKYLPYVKNPVKAFQSLNYELHEHSSSESSEKLPDSNKVLILVKLDDVQDGEGRLGLLQRHDKLMNELCSEVQKKYEKAVCVLTAKRTSWIEPEKSSRPVRHLLQINSANEGSSKDTKEVMNLYYHANAGMMYTKSPPLFIVKNDNQTYTLSLNSPDAVTKGNNALDVNLLSNKTGSPDRVRLSFKFGSKDQTWQLNSIEVKYPAENPQKSELNTVSYIGASLGNSFHTPSEVVFDNKFYQLVFKGLQAQYFAKSTNKKFGPAEDSVYFFTIPILSGLFVTSLLVAIVLIGLTMIFDIKTMDQFDDPKGKSITINASD